jgi:hypothetical protein
VRVTKEQLEKLKQAQRLIAEVQIEMLQKEDKLPVDERSEEWQRLFGIRAQLGREVYRLEKT